MEMETGPGSGSKTKARTRGQRTEKGRPGIARPTLSVVLNNYNHAHYLPTALEAILEQSVRPLEVLVVDDGSTDDSLRLIDRYREADSLVRLEALPRNRGLFHAANLGLSLVRGDYVYLAAADDWVLPDFFEKMLDLAIRHPEAGLLMGDVVQVSPEGDTMAVYSIERWREELYAGPEAFLNEYLASVPASHSLCSGTIYRRECLVEAGGYRPDLGHWADTFAARAIGLKYGACYLPEPVICWRYSQRSVAHSTTTREALAIATAAAEFMRSPPFRDRFPANYIRAWEASYREIVLRPELAHNQEAIHETAYSRRDQLIAALHCAKRAVSTFLPFLGRIKFGKVINPIIEQILVTWARNNIKWKEARLRRYRGPLLRRVGKRLARIWSRSDAA